MTEEESKEEPEITELSEKHEAFVQEYLRSFNATKAYMKIYPNSSYEAARRSSSDLLTKHDLKQRIKEITDETRSRLKHELPQLMAKQAYFNLADFLRDDGTIDPQRVKGNEIPGIIKSYKTKVTKTMSKDGQEEVTEDITLALIDQNKTVENLAKVEKLVRDDTQNVIAPNINISFDEDNKPKVTTEDKTTIPEE